MTITANQSPAVEVSGHEPPALVSADPALTERVLASFDTTPSPRLQRVLRSLVAHLHAFTTDVALTEDEWTAAVDFLTRVGQISDDHRQETILLSDVLGLSMLVVGINHPDNGGPATPSTVFGPFFVDDSPAFDNGQDISGGAAGRPCFYSGQVRSTTGEAVPGALIEIWHSDEDGNYDVQNAEVGIQNRGHLHSDPGGRYSFSSVLPEAYPIPEDGPVGDLLHATGRSPWRPAHVHFMISAPGYATLTTHIFRSGDSYLGSDAVFGEKQPLIQVFTPHEPGPAPDGRVVDEPFFTMTYDFVLDRQSATLSS